MAELKFAELRKVAKSLDIKAVGKKREALLTEVAEAIEAKHSKEGLEATDKLLVFYNTHCAEGSGTAAEGGEGEPKTKPNGNGKGKTTTAKKQTAKEKAAAAKAKKVKEKKEAPPTTKKARKQQDVGRYGARVGSQAQKLDDAYYEGCTVEVAAGVADCSKNRAGRRLKHLENKLGLTVTKKKDGVFKVKEAKV